MIQSDVAAFEELLADVRKHQHDDALHCQTCQQTLQAVVDRYDGAFLAGFNFN